jgi:predicted acylesterase/phospholipase RssA
MPRKLSPDARRAAEIFAGANPAPGELEELAKKLKKERTFGAARRLLARRFEEPDVRASPDKKLKVGGQWALCTYKDPDLPAEARLEQALDILRQVTDLDTTTDQEILGLTGAVYKRRWELLARKEDLERSLSFYLRGYQQGPQSRDPWYPGINAAFVLDLLAAQEAADATGGAGQIPAAAAARLAKASEIRTDIVTHLIAPTPATTDNWWELVTIAEAHFGLGKFSAAKPLLQVAAPLMGDADWERESTLRQLAALTRLREKLPVPDQEPLKNARDAMSVLSGGSPAAVANAFHGRFGVALSGGGFRASFFHIGVLARLAELDLLRSVECLSCVSGGSIIGAHYYLHVRHLLQTKADAEITAQDYVDIVGKIVDEFLDGVQRNIRTRVAAEWTTNLKMMCFPHYSRTLRVGELYERELFSRVQDGENGKPRWLNELIIHPAGEPQNFAPKTHNWKRHAKVPNLVLNATTLNTGHNWQFTASWMGEPPAGINSAIDANYRLRRLYHDEAPLTHRATRLGYAVAASSCVPGLFEPLPLDLLYPDRVVGLVDGGVHDNQGTGALLEQDCNVVLVSDASGQMDTIDDTPSGLLSVPLRANSILQARVREAQYDDVATRRGAHLLSGLVFLHLKKDLDADTIDWIGCQDPSEPRKQDPLTSYGVQKSVQRELAAIRTDLDSFSDTEAYALMTSGYLMAREALQQPGALGFPLPAPLAGRWKFLAALEERMKAGTPDPHFLRRLRIAKSIAFKVWRLSRQLQVATVGVSLGLIALLIVRWQDWSAIPLYKPSWELTIGTFILTVIGAAVVALLIGLLRRRLRFPKTFQQVAIGFGMATFGFLVARLHLHLFDPLFLRDGRLR